MNDKMKTTLGCIKIRNSWSSLQAYTILELCEDGGLIDKTAGVRLSTIHIGTGRLQLQRDF